jgi:RNA polymerase sigma-70 factor (ECF subfamily)
MNGRRDAKSVIGPSDGGSTSLSLLFRLKANDAEAWERLVLLYAPLVYHWCHRFNLPAQDAADVFQEVFQSVAAKISAFRKEQPSDSFRGWLRIITQNKIYDHYRRLGREPQAAGGTEANLRFAQVPVAPDDEEIDDETPAYQQVMHRALEIIRCEFAPRTWQAFWRVTVDGQSPAEVGQELKMSPGNVRVAKSRVLHRLRQELGELM